MSLWIIPIKMKPAEVQIKSDRLGVYTRLTSFADDSPPGGPRVLVREGPGVLIAEFRTSVTGLLGGSKTYRTVERVTLNAPVDIRFEGIEGPLDLLRDRISLAEESGGTMVRYESTFGLRGSLLGWLLGMFYVKRLLGRFMQQHLQQLKASIEREEAK